MIKHVKSYVHDSLDFLNKCSRFSNQYTILATFDITSLYTNIPHEYGIEAISYWIDTYPDTINSRFPKEFIIEGLLFVLENNIFHFNDEYFQQLKGTAMGTDVAPTYSTLTVGYSEVNLYNLCEQRWGLEIRNYVYENWSRFLDDCEILLDKQKINPEEFQVILNSINSNIQYTMDHSKAEIPFLDILMKKDKTGIWMDLYHKPTDTRRYVPFSSNHPNHCKRNLPFTLARRICVIVENNSIRQKHLEELKSTLYRQEYPMKIIEAGIKKALSIPHEQQRQKSTKTTEHILPFISTHNPNNAQVFNIIKSSVDYLKANQVPGFSKELKVIQSRRQAPNLKKILTKAEFTSWNPGVTKCGNKRCECCHHLLLSDTYKFKNVNKTFKFKTSMSCDSSNLIYVVICSSCKEEYIGETGLNKTKLRDRVRVYRQHIRQPQYQQLKVEGHLRTCSGGNFKVFPFLQMRTDSKFLRKSFEERFQKLFKTKLNRL